MLWTAFDLKYYDNTGWTIQVGQYRLIGALKLPGIKSDRAMTKKKILDRGISEISDYNSPVSEYFLPLTPLI